MNPYGAMGGGPNSGYNAAMFPGWGSVQSGYQGSSPYGPQGKPTWAGGISQLTSPFYKDPYWGNPVDNNSAAFQAVGSKPFDAAAWIGQRIAMPAVTFGMTSALFAGAGRSMGQGLAQGMFGANMLGRGAGAILGTVGSFGLPFAIGTAAAHAVDAAIFQPYIRTRQQTEDIVRNFSGVTFAGSAGNPISGRGLSNYSASTIAQGVDRAGVKDMTFSSNQMHSIMGMGMRAGLFDDVGAGQIQTRFKDIAAQVKLLVSISKDPNIQSAIEQLSQLRAGGASITGGIHSTAARAFQQMGMQASIAGVSVQQIMAAGQQGQYMYQANGMTPYLGQMAAGNVYAGFSGAFRAGALSPALLARMGGLQGATNSVLSGQLAAANSPLNMLGLYNRSFGGGAAGGSITDVAARFGSSASRNPVQTAGDLTLYGPAMMSQQSEELGGSSQNAEEQAIKILRASGQRPSGKGGKWSPGQIASALQSIPGMTPDAIRAIAAQRAGDTNSATLDQSLEAIDAQGREQLLQVASQTGMYDGPIGRATTAVRHGMHDIALGFSENFSYPVASMAARASDWVGETWNDLFQGSTVPKQKKDFSGGKRIHSKSRGSTADSLYDHLNEEAGRPGPLGDLARKILNGSPNSKDVAQFARDAGLDNVNEAMENSPRLFDQFSSDLTDSKITYEDGKAVTKKEIPFSLPYHVSMEGDLKIAGQARDMIMEADKNGLSLATDMDSLLAKPEYADLAKQLKNYSPSDRAGAVKYDAAYSSKYGYNDRTKRLDGQRVNYDFNGSVKDIAQWIATTRATDKDHQAKLTASKSEVDWSSFTDTMGRFDGAVDKFARAVAGMPGASTDDNGKSKADWTSGKAWSDAWNNTFKSQTARN